MKYVEIIWVLERHWHTQGFQGQCWSAFCLRTLCLIHRSHGFTSIYRSSHPSDTWCISSEVSAARALSITVTLRALGLFEGTVPVRSTRSCIISCFFTELTDFTNAVIAFYATSLPLIIGPNYKPHSLSYLARQWFDTSRR